MWGLTFGGHVKAGETYEENIVSEMYEELGLQSTIDQLTFLGNIKSLNHKHIGKAYVYHWNGKLEDIVCNDGEVEQVKLVTLTEYQSMIDSGLKTSPINPMLQVYYDNLPK